MNERQKLSRRLYEEKREAEANGDEYRAGACKVLMNSLYAQTGWE